MERFQELLVKGAMTILYGVWGIAFITFIVSILWQFYQLALGDWHKAPLAGLLCIATLAVIISVCVGFVVEKIQNFYGDKNES